MRRRIGLTVILAALSPLIRASDATSLIQAVRNSDKDTIAALLRTQHVDVNQAQPDGATALSWAALRGDVAIADLLIRAGPMSIAPTNTPRRRFPSPVPARIYP